MSQEHIKAIEERLADLSGRDEKISRVRIMAEERVKTITADLDSAMLELKNLGYESLEAADADKVNIQLELEQFIMTHEEELDNIEIQLAQAKVKI